MNANLDDYFLYVMILVAAQFKASVCGRWLAGIAGSNPAEGWMCCQVEVVPSVVFLTECDREASIIMCLSPVGSFVSRIRESFPYKPSSL